MSSFTSRLILSVTSEGKYWQLERPFTFHLGSQYSRTYVKVPRLTLTDFASIPRFILPFLPWWAKFNKSSPIHDYLYRIKQVMGKPITRKEADNIWLEAMFVDFRNHRSGKLVAYLEYYGVRAFAGLAWYRKAY